MVDLAFVMICVINLVTAVQTITRYVVSYSYVIPMLTLCIPYNIPLHPSLQAFYMTVGRVVE